MSQLLEQVPRLDERTPEDWRNLLLKRLRARRDEIDVYESYYDGEHPLQFATTKYREAFGNLFGAFADNWCQIVVDAPVERLKVVGFQIGGSASEAAWEIWQRNALDVESVIAHTEAGKTGRSYLLVDPNDGEPRITVEHCAEMIVVHDPGDRRKRLAALKWWLGEDGYQYANLYLPDVVLKWESEAQATQAGIGEIDWLVRDEIANPLEVVPAIPLENKPGLTSKVHSDLESAIPLQNAVNKLCSDMIVASEYGAFKQRVATGVDVPIDPETGQPIAKEQMKAAMSRLWTWKQPDAKVTSLDATDLSNFVVAIEMVIQHLAAQTRTPPHYLLGSMVNASGDALSVAEAGLVSKCRTKQLFFSDSWEEAIALALGSTGTTVEHAECEAMWANPERVSQSQLTDAAIKKQVVGVPVEMIWLELGYTPEQIVEMKKMAAAEEAKQAAKDALAVKQQAEVAAASAPTAPAAPTPGGTDG